MQGEGWRRHRRLCALFGAFASSALHTAGLHPRRPWLLSQMHWTASGRVSHVTTTLGDLPLTDCTVSGHLIVRAALSRLVPPTPLTPPAPPRTVMAWDGSWPRACVSGFRRPPAEAPATSTFFHKM